MRCLCFLAGLLAAWTPTRAADADFRRDVLPIFRQHCLQCHGPAAQKAGLRLDTVAAIKAGGDSGAVIVAGKSAESLLIQAVSGADGVKKMPIKGAGLSAAEIAVVSRWIDAGAVAPADDRPETAVPAEHWAFVPPVRPMILGTGHTVDVLVRAELAQRGITPSPLADPRTRLRRLALDLTGLPPTPEESDAFAADPSPAAYARHVERLLASPHFGERWGRHWLDAARYADSNGYSIDAPREIWKYRDWVINAFNSDMPFAQFVTEQMAGDLLPNATAEQKTATGFHRNTMINQEGGVDPEQFRIEAVADRVNTTGTVFLGLTVGCCRCHDHKYDPLATREYYQLFAFLNDCDEPTLEFADESIKSKRDAIRNRMRALETELHDAEKTIFDGLSESDRSGNVRAIHELVYTQRTDKQNVAMYKFLAGKDVKLKGKIAEHAKLKASEPKFPSTLVLAARKTPRETFIHKGGDFTRPGDRVQPGVPKVLHPLPANEKADRLTLARWLADANNPLTPRVMANRIWQQLFGRGIVETENDFGTQGTPPTHPALLDALACDFRDQGSVKQIIRQIVTSETYGQASYLRPDLRESDLNNRTLARQSRIRLEAEIVRDAALTASGLLSRKIGGPSVRPPQPDGVFKFTQVPRDWKASDGDDRFRRGLYTQFWRAAPHPALLVFDAPDSTATCTRRPRSNTPLQALTLLNDTAWIELAQGLASRLTRESPADDDTARVERAVRLSLSRPPLPRERDRLLAFVHEQRASYATDAAAAAKLTKPGAPAEWVALARVLFNLDEFITRE